MLVLLSSLMAISAVLLLFHLRRAVREPQAAAAAA